MNHKGIMIVALFEVSAAASAQTIVNGQFSTGDLTGWSTNTSVSGSWAVDENPYGLIIPGQIDEPYIAETGCVGSACTDYGASTANYLSQTFTTVVGKQYVVGYEFTNYGSAGPSELDVYYNGTLARTFNPVPAVASVDNLPLSAYQGWVSTADVFTATGTSSAISFLGRDDSGDIALADVIVFPSPAPEPQTFALLLAGLGVFCIILKRYNSKSG